jgi:integrase
MSSTIPILRGKLSLVQRQWTNKSGDIQFRYYARIRQPHLKKYAELTLQSRNEDAAREEAFQHYAKFQSNIEKGTDISVRRQNYLHFQKLFLEHQTKRARDKQITDKRVLVLKHCLKSLQAFYRHKKKPNLDNLAEFYDREFNDWRSNQKVQTTKKQLSVAFRNNEINTHKQFFTWAKEQGYCDRQITIPNLKIRRDPKRFPYRHYRKLVVACLRDIKGAQNIKNQWQKMNYYHLILLMNGIGCRVAETKNMRWTHIHQSNDGTLIDISGKNKQRTILLPPRVAGHLQRLKEWKIANGRDYDTSKAFIFSDYNKIETSKHYSPDTRRNWFRLAGIENWYNLEWVSFRHDFISRTLTGGVDSLSVAKYCGTSQAMIEQTYGHLTSKETYANVFRNVSDDALKAKEPPKFMK